ncbi:MAG TPA: tetratricopeptide repeat protein [Stellaceae bacterium]
MTRMRAVVDQFARFYPANDPRRGGADTQQPIGNVRGELLPGRSAPSPAEPIYFLLHIPKTAGQTIQQHFAEHCAPGVFWRSYHKMRLGRRTSPEDLPDPARARIIAGHNITRSVENLFPGHEIRRILLLRDPLEFHVSYYNWSMMDNIAKGLGTYSFDLHFRALQPNFMADFLLSRWLEIPRRARLLMADEQKHRILNQMLAGFWFVGEHTDCDRVIAAIAPDLGVPPAAPRRNTAAELQAQTGWRLVTSASLSPAMRYTIHARNRLDQALWEHWRKAGFQPAAIDPPPLERGATGSLLGHEILRPWFKLRRFVQRQHGSWLRATRAGEVRFLRADRARDAGQWELAVRHYREALRILPRGPGIWIQYGHALKENGKVAEAETAYRRALRLNPHSADAPLQLGYALKLQGRIAEARTAYLRSALLDPGRSVAREELIGLGWTDEEVEQAIAEMRGTGPLSH